MATLADFRNQLKAALAISGSSAERGFDDPSLDQHIREAAREFSLYVPVEASADVVIAGGTRTIALSGLSRPIRVLTVETPPGNWPRTLVDFEVYGNTVTLDVLPSSNQSATVHYTQAHLIDSSGSTVEPEHEGVIVQGAAALALLSRATGAAQTLETSTNQPVTYQHLRLAQERLRQWRVQVRRLGGMGRRQMYSQQPSAARRNVADCSFA